MSHWADLRQQARAQHSILLQEAGGDASASGLLAAAARLTGIRPEPVPAGDAMLDGQAQAVLDRAAESIFYNAEADPSILLLWLAHEYAHLWLNHGDCTRCSAEQIDLEVSDENVPLGVALVEGYSPEERREREANVYARELLLPSTLMREWYLDNGLGAADISARTGLPEPLVYHQLTQALLTPERHGPEALAPKLLPGLDNTQAEAAYAPTGPVLVEAGPGTGKTRTLVARVEYLLTKRGVEPTSILCLTFSIKAAEEMRERIARVRPDDAMRMQIGTFHSFGLELLRKEGSRLGYPPRPRVLDPASALFVMERLLPKLGLSHYQYLYEPTANLRDLLDAVSRAKDELCTPDQYRALAQAMRENATSPVEVNRAERALEVANVYAIYQAELDRERMLDFGDLIHRAVDLLRAAPDLRADLGARFQHILVDEYQDVNRASGVLLEELSNENGGRGLWVVGDARQSIYRWRGASPANMRLFKERFPGASVKVLGVNYRSHKEVVDLAAALAPTMKVNAGGAFKPWIAARGIGGRLQMEIAEDGPSEYLHIAREIEQRRVSEGTPYGSQAILCRSHTQLARVAAELERAGVPALYLGDLFERPEIRDMLSLLSLATQRDGRGLLRVARFPEYQVPLGDVLTLIRTAKDRSVPFPRALALAEELELTEQGKVGVRQIAQHLDGLCYGSTAWSMLAQYLFNRSAYLRLLSVVQSVASQQQRLALYQLLQFAHQNRGLENPDRHDPKRVFLDYVRHLEIFGEEKQLRNLPESAAALDAVRLLTIHASKGLQFPVVHIPSLGAGIFPAKKQGAMCPPPAGMIAGVGGDSHEEEEECLFFVAISRAENILCLSRAERNGKSNSKPSRLLLNLEPCLPRAPAATATWLRPSTLVEPAEEIPPGTPDVFEEKALDAYMRCPRQYYYERVLGLGGLRDDAVYAEVHKCVYDVIGWIQAERGDGRTPDLAGALGRLNSAWVSHGPVEHPYEEMYRESAEIMVGEAVDRLTGAGVPGSRPAWEVKLPHGRVRLTPDHIVFGGTNENGAPTVFRLRTGKLSKSELDKPIYGLYQRAFHEAYPGHKLDAHVLSLSTGQQLPIDFKAGPVGTRVSKYDDAIAGICRGDFAPDPSDRRCPRCPHYFICPAAEDG